MLLACFFWYRFAPLRRNAISNGSTESHNNLDTHVLQQTPKANNFAVTDGILLMKSDRKKFDQQYLKRVKSLHYDDCNAEQIDQLWEFAGEMQYCVDIPVEDRMSFVIDHFPITLIDDVADNLIRISSIDELHTIILQIMNLPPSIHRANIFYLILQRMVKLEAAENEYESLFKEVEPDEEILLRKNLAITKSMSKKIPNK